MKQWVFIVFSVLFLAGCQGMEAFDLTSLNSVNPGSETEPPNSSLDLPSTIPSEVLNPTTTQTPQNPNTPLTSGTPENPNPPSTPETPENSNPRPINPDPPLTTRPPNPNPPPTTQPPNPEPPEDECPSRAYCFGEEGLFHQPTSNRPGNNQFIFDDLPARTYQRIHVTMQFKISDWSPIRSAAIHNIFWLAIDGHNDLLGYFNATGPNNNNRGGGLVFRHGVNLVHGDKPKVTKPIRLEKQTTYTVTYDYDTQYNRISLKLFNQNGQLVTEIQHQPNIPNIILQSHNRMRIHFGNTAPVFSSPECSIVDELTMGFNIPGCWAVEVPSYGWEYRNLKAIVYY